MLIVEVRPLIFSYGLGGGGGGGGGLAEGLNFNKIVLDFN